MNEILLEIREFIEKGYFKNEENVRFSLVSRISMSAVVLGAVVLGSAGVGPR